MDNIIAIYKEKGPTSHDIIYRLRKITGVKKIGHAGTLDPLAEGVLVVGIGREATKKLGIEVQKEKEYVTTIMLGVTSTTDDAEGKKTPHAISSVPTHTEVEKVVKSFEGIIKQVPPVFSAIKVCGKEAYKSARKGKPVELEARQVEIKKIDIVHYDWPLLTINAVTGPGVYIRSLGRDIGERLGVGGGYLTYLKRSRVGEYSCNNAVTLDQFQKLFAEENV